MKNIIALLLVIPFTVLAQQGMPNMNLPGIDQANMPEMMANMQKMSTCMSKIKQAELQRVENMARKQNASVQKLCRTGKRSAAKQKGMEIAKQMLNDPTVKKINQCQEIMAGQIPSAAGLDDTMEKADDMHICDQIANPMQ